jgi:hypothetical protein
VHPFVPFSKLVQASGLELVPLLADGNLVDAAWGAERPALPDAPLRVHALEWAGQSVQQKLAEVRVLLPCAACVGLDEVGGTILHRCSCGESIGGAGPSVGRPNLTHAVCHAFVHVHVFMC